MGLRFWFLTGILERLPARAPGLSGAHRARSTPNGEEEARGGDATLEGSRESSLHIRDTNLSWVDRF